LPQRPRGERNPAAPPLVSGRLERVSGVDANRVGVYPAANEYEICFKCHADLAPQYPSSRGSSTARTHGSNSPVEPLVPSGHRDGENRTFPASFGVRGRAQHGQHHLLHRLSQRRRGISRGPHGSTYSPILRDRYETADGTGENPAVYALCYRCHQQGEHPERRELPENTLSNRGGHSGHLAAGAPCSACHDPHGIVDDFQSEATPTSSTSTRRIVSPASTVPPNNRPAFTMPASFSGSCTLRLPRGDTQQPKRIRRPGAHPDRHRGSENDHEKIRERFPGNSDDPGGAPGT